MLFLRICGLFSYTLKAQKQYNPIGPFVKLKNVIPSHNMMPMAFSKLPAR